MFRLSTTTCYFPHWHQFISCNRFCISAGNRPCGLH